MLGTLAFATFLTAMTLGRWFGPPLLDRYGRVAVVRALCLLAVVGLMVFVFSPWLGLAFVGALLWGAGASLGFPVGMSAAADEPAAAATRVSVVASIGYVAFLGGPPLIGFLGEHVGVLKALTVVAVLLGVAALLAGSLRPPVSTAAAAGPIAHRSSRRRPDRRQRSSRSTVLPSSDWISTRLMSGLARSVDAFIVAVRPGSTRHEPTCWMWPWLSTTISQYGSSSVKSAG